ncbi:MAG: TIGR00730 family Rossman fold protein [Myxococcota bacterium]
MSPEPRVAVFCGSQDGADPAFLAAARALGAGLAAKGWGLVYGGAQVGTMGAVADGALEAGGKVYGVIPQRLGSHEVAHHALTELFVVDSMHARKAMMAWLSRAFLILPGGYGTLDELFEALTWRQLGYHRKPIGLVNVAGFYDDLIAHAERAVTQGFLRSEHQELFFVEPTPEAALRALEPRLGAAQ